MKKIVTIGGGTGSFTVLSGIKSIPDVSITAIVSMADDGGSTGVLRDELGVLPPGDLRQCLVALSEHSDVVRSLMSYRFSEGGLTGHSFGNIFLAALEKVTGNFVQGVEIASDILKIKGRVFPVTSDNAELLLELEDAEVLEGEHAINMATIQHRGIRRFYYAGGVHINEHAAQAIREADVIILGPGNYYCSILPNLVVEGMRDALLHSSARIVFPCNLTNKKGHTEYWGVSDYVRDIERYLPRPVDTILINDREPSEEQVQVYKIEVGDGVMVYDDGAFNSRHVRTPLLSSVVVTHQPGDKIASVRSFIRHDSDLLRAAIQSLL